MDSSGLTQSFLQHQVELIVADVKELVSRVSDVHFVEADNLTVPAITYEVSHSTQPRTRHLHLQLGCVAVVHRLMQLLRLSGVDVLHTFGNKHCALS